MKLYEINTAYRAIMAAIEDNDGILDGLEESLNDITDAFSEKAESICVLIKECNAEAEAFGNEIARLQAHKKSMEAKAERLQAYLANNCPTDGLQTAHFKLSFRKSEAVEVPASLDLFADSPYVNTKTSYTADKAELKKALKAGEIIPWAVLVSRNNLQIK